jgi:hypothetical protein
VFCSACTKKLQIQLGDEGFECVAVENQPLVWRALVDAGTLPADLGSAEESSFTQRLATGSGATFQLVLDVIPIPAGTPAVLGKFATACNGGYCTPSLRRCYEVDGLHGGVKNGVAYIDDFLEHVATDGGLIGGVPSGTVVVRAVGTTQSCAEVADPHLPFDRDRVVGCDLSTPQVLANASGVVTLDLDVAGHFCYCEVQYCAGVDQLESSCTAF